MNRIIITGNNRDFPPTRFVGCRECDTDGWVYACGSDPSIRLKVTCPVCNGDGAVLRKSPPSDAARCLPASGTARPPAFSTARDGRAPSSGMTPDARATGDLSCFVQQGAKTHPVQRSVLSSSALQSPSGSIPPVPRGTFWHTVEEVATVVTALFVFGWVFLVLWVLA